MGSDAETRKMQVCSHYQPHHQSERIRLDKRTGSCNIRPYDILFTDMMEGQGHCAGCSNRSLIEQEVATKPAVQTPRKEGDTMSRQEDGGLAHLKKILERKAASLDVPGAQGKETFEEYLIRNREYLLDSANDEVLWDLGQGVNVSPQVLQKWLEDLDKPQGPDPQAGIIALVKALNLPVRQYGIEVSGTIWECLGDLVFDGQGLADIAPLAEKLGAPVET